MNTTYIIAEAGVNHNGEMDKAYQLIDEAVKADADAIKFQTFKANLLVTNTASQTNYQKKNIGKVSSQLEMLRKLELSEEQFKQLKDYCHKKRIDFLSTPFDDESLEFLVNELKLRTIKVSSGDLNNYPFLYEIGKKKCHVILSTGMSSIEEIHKALSYLVYGMADYVITDAEKVMEFYHSKIAKDMLRENVSVLHCTTAYPTPINEVNLNAINYLQEKLDVPVGFSDHTEGIIIPCSAVAKGAKIVEKHFTLDKSLPGPDHKASLEPTELQLMVQSIRDVEKATGIFGKKLTNTEIENIDLVRKSLVANAKINKGEVFTKNNLTIKRPGNGISPEHFWSYLGKRASKDYEKDDLI